MKILALGRYALSVAAFVVLAACSAPGSHVTPPSNHVFSNASVRAAASYLYVASYGGTDGACKSSAGCVVEYAGGNGSPVRVIRDGVVNPRAIALDGNDTLYSSNRDNVTVYEAGRTSKRFALHGVVIPYYVVTDGGDNIYVADHTATRRGGMIAVFTSGDPNAKRYIENGVDDAWVLGFHSGHLYVGNATGSVAEYASSGSLPIRTIKSGVHAPRAFAFDASRDLYVANSLTRMTTKHKDQSRSTLPVPLHRCENPRWNSNPLALALGAKGNLFVANFKANTVTVYASGSTSVLRTLKTQYPPRAVTIGPGGDVYVGETQLIEVFAPGGATPVRSIQQGGWALAWGDK